MKNTLKLVAITILVALNSVTVFAETFKLKTSEALELRAGLQALDGIAKEVPQTGADSKIVLESYEFTGKVRMVIARDLAALEQVNTATEAVRVSLIKQVTGGKTDIPKENAEQRAKYFTLLNEALAVPVEVNLTRITEADLNLEVNKKLPGSVITVLLRLIDSTSK